MVRHWALALVAAPAAAAYTFVNAGDSSHLRHSEASADSPFLSSAREWITQDPWLQAVNVVLFLAACLALHKYRQSSQPGQNVMGLGMQSGFQVFLFLGFTTLSTMHMFLQARAGATKYSPVAATVLIYVGKATVAGCMHIRKDGLDMSALMRPSGGRFGRLPAILCVSIPGAMFAVYDTLSFISLARVDPVTYQIVVHCRIFAIAVIWQTAFHRWISGMQWLAMVLFVVASLTKSADRLTNGGGGAEGFAVHQFGLLVLFGQIAFSAFNSVLSEVLLKELPIPTDLQNFAMYSQGLVFLLLGLMVSSGPGSLYTELLSSSAWARLAADPWMVASILCMIAFGIFAAYFLRELSCVLKELTGCVVTVFAAGLEWGILKASPCSIVGVQSLILCLTALTVYNSDPLVARKDAYENVLEKKGLKDAAGDTILPVLSKSLQRP